MWREKTNACLVGVKAGLRTKGTTMTITELVVDCKSVRVESWGDDVRLTLHEVDAMDLDVVNVYDVIDRKKFLKHHGLKLKK